MASNIAFPYSNLSGNSIKYIYFIEFKIPSIVRCTVVLCGSRKKIKYQTVRKKDTLEQPGKGKVSSRKKLPKLCPCRGVPCEDYKGFAEK